MVYSRNLFSKFSIIIGGIIALLILLSFFIRTIPFFSGITDPLVFVGIDDPTYQLRRIEQVIANYPNVAWFDPMTYFPYGQPMHWGPLFPFIGGTVCLLAGAATRMDIISVSLLIPCALAALLVPIIYLLVSKIADWKAGIIAAFFITIVPGQFFTRSYYGYLDHHIGEVFFSTLFCLCYISTLIYSRKHPVEIHNLETWKIPVLLGLLCGITYVAGLALMPTVILFALIVGMFTPIWFIIQRYIGHSGASALLINSVTFFIAILGFFIIGVHGEGGLNYYTIGHPVAYSLLILANIVLFALSYRLKDKPVWYYVAAILGVFLLGIIALAVILPDLFTYLVMNANDFFGSSDIHWRTIREARPWTWDDAWSTFQFGLLLFGAGILVLVYRIRKELCPSHVFTLLWALVIFYSTWQHLRYEYYLAVPVSILAGIVVGFALDLAKLPSGLKDWFFGMDKFGSRRNTNKKPDKGHGKHLPPAVKYKKNPVKTSSYLILAVILVLSLLFTYNALGRDLMSGGYRLNNDWREATEWLQKNTPDPGLDYYALYDEKNFTYPEKAYGVMSWWDYGHIILFLGHRMPDANPFQYGVNGPNGSARFFLAQDESEADKILDNLKSRYVITDIDMDTGYLQAISIWDNPDVGIDPYQRSFVFPNPEDPSSGMNYTLLTERYYKTMVSRLHNFDGSYTEPGKVLFIRYTKPSASGLSYPVVVNGTEIGYSAGKSLVDSFNATENPQQDVILANFGYTNPVSPVPALGHYRLIYESNTRTTPADAADLRYVKIFEHVNGAKIPGDGILELPIRTNTGREFIYRTMSVNRTFTVPYPTETTIGVVTITGPYRNTNTGEEYTVTDDQVIKGLSL